MFRRTGGEQASISTYRHATGQVIPRILLIIDEFHRLFEQEDSLASGAAQDLDRIIREGRSFGVHCLLASQTLMGMSALGRHTLNQVKVRMALQCSEDDARIVLTDSNTSPSLLTRPGEGIFNSAGGQTAENKRFQAPLVPETTRLEFLRKLLKLAEEEGIPEGPIVYKRNEVVSLDVLPRRTGKSRSLALRFGRPVSLEPEVSVALPREGGRNVLIVGRSEAVATGLLASILKDLRYLVPSHCKVEVFDFMALGGAADDAASSCGYPVFRRREFGKRLTALQESVERQVEASSAAGGELVVFINGLGKARDLDPEDYSPEAQALGQALHAILRDGPEVGVHVVAWCDSIANMERRIDRKTEREFGIRVAFSMSSEDSMRLIDSEAAASLWDREAVLADLDSGRAVKFQPLGSPPLG